MKPVEFCYWLQGWLEITGAKTMDRNQMKMVRDHLALVFTKKTPTRKKTNEEPTYCSQIKKNRKHLRDIEAYQRLCDSSLHRDKRRACG